MPHSHKMQDDANVQYEFSYAVDDRHTADIKSHRESRKGDAVEGAYELIDSDGYKRTVEYTADDENGFNAVVRREPTDIRVPQPQPQPQHQMHDAQHHRHHRQQPQYQEYYKPQPFVTKAYAPVRNYHARPFDHNASTSNMRYMHKTVHDNMQHNHNWDDGASHYVRFNAPGIVSYSY